MDRQLEAIHSQMRRLGVGPGPAVATSQEQDAADPVSPAKGHRRVSFGVREEAEAKAECLRREYEEAKAKQEAKKARLRSTDSFAVKAAKER